MMEKIAKMVQKSEGKRKEDKINLELGGLDALIGPLVAKVSIIGDELTFTLLYGDVLKYKRVE